MVLRGIRIAEARVRFPVSPPEEMVNFKKKDAQASFLFSMKRLPMKHSTEKANQKMVPLISVIYY